MSIPPDAIKDLKTYKVLIQSENMPSKI